MDTFVIPRTIVVDKIYEKKNYSFQRSIRTHHTYNIKVNNHSLDIPEGIFSNIFSGDSTIVFKSSLTGSISKLEVYNSYIVPFNTGIANSGVSGFYFFATFVGSVLLFFFYHRINNQQGRINITYFIFIISLILLFYHLDLQFF